MSKRTPIPVPSQVAKSNTIMKSKTQKNHPLEAYGADTNERKLYEVTLFLKQEKSAFLTVPAASEHEARQWATSMAKNLNMDWRTFWENVSVNRVRQVTEGGRHV